MLAKCSVRVVDGAIQLDYMSSYMYLMSIAFLIQIYEMARYRLIEFLGFVLVQPNFLYLEQ